MQIHYKILVDYSANRLSFCELDSTQVDKRFDLFPIMPFCYGATESDKSVLCSADARYRISITADHPFTIWLLDNAENLCKNYPRQFEQIIAGLKHANAERLIDLTNEIIDQISKSSNRYGVDTSTYRELTLSDFKEIEETV